MIRAMDRTRRTSRDVERKISEFFLRNRRMPTYSEMTALLGVRSKSVVHFWVKKLLGRRGFREGFEGFSPAPAPCLPAPSRG